MKTYQFDAEEFAKLEYLLTQMVSFHHQERNEEELRNFQAESFPLLREVQYQIVASKIDERQHLAISKADPWPPDGPSAKEAIAILTTIFAH